MLFRPPARPLRAADQLPDRAQGHRAPALHALAAARRRADRQPRPRARRLLEPIAAAGRGLITTRSDPQANSLPPRGAGQSHMALEVLAAVPSPEAGEG